LTLSETWGFEIAFNKLDERFSKVSYLYFAITNFSFSPQRRRERKEKTPFFCRLEAPSSLKGSSPAKEKNQSLCDILGLYKPAGHVSYCFPASLSPLNLKTI